MHWAKKFCQQSDHSSSAPTFILPLLPVSFDMQIGLLNSSDPKPERVAPVATYR